MKETKKTQVKLPCGKLCGHNCADGCAYWNPGKKDSNGRQYCNWNLLLSMQMMVQENVPQDVIMQLLLDVRMLQILLNFLLQTS